MKNFNILLLGENKSHLQAILKSLSKKKKNEIDDNVIQPTCQQDLRVTKDGNIFTFHLKIMNQHQNLKAEMNAERQDLIIVCYDVHSQNPHKQISKFFDEIYSTRKVVQIILVGIQSQEEFNKQNNIEGIYQNYQKFHVAIMDQRNILVLFKSIFNYLIKQTDNLLSSELNSKRDLKISKRRENEKNNISNPSQNKQSIWFPCCKQ